MENPAKKRRQRRDHHHNRHQFVTTDLRVGNDGDGGGGGLGPEDDGNDEEEEEDSGELKLCDMLRDKLRLKGSSTTSSVRQESKRNRRGRHHHRRVENGFVVDGRVEDVDDDEDHPAVAVSQPTIDTSSAVAMLDDRQICNRTVTATTNSLQHEPPPTLLAESNALAASPLDNHANDSGPRSPPPLLLSPSSNDCRDDASVNVPLPPPCVAAVVADPTSSSLAEPGCIRYVAYESELQMPDIMRLIQKDLSEPYSIYTYRYFIHNWPKLCFLAMDGDRCIGAIVCKLDMHRAIQRGYIAMLAVDENYRKRKIGSNLVLKAIHAMVMDAADEVVLETEVSNRPALRLYENLGFVRDKRLFRYYLNGVDALRLKLWVR